MSKYMKKLELFFTRLNVFSCTAASILAPTSKIYPAAGA